MLKFRMKSYALALTVVAALALGLAGCENKDLSAPGPDKPIQVDDSPRPTSSLTPTTETTSGMATAVLIVPGMTCGSCPETVKGIVSGFEGVKKVDCDQKSLTATVQYDPEKTNATRIAESLGKADSHYKATVKNAKG
jgi:mercuric ion binding protein